MCLKKEKRKLIEEKEEMEIERKVNERKVLKSEENNWRKEIAKEWEKVDGRERKIERWMKEKWMKQKKTRKKV